MTAGGGGNPIICLALKEERSSPCKLIGLLLCPPITIAKMNSDVSKPHGHPQRSLARYVSGIKMHFRETLVVAFAQIHLSLPHNEDKGALKAVLLKS